MFWGRTLCPVPLKSTTVIPIKSWSPSWLTPANSQPYPPASPLYVVFWTKDNYSEETRGIQSSRYSHTTNHQYHHWTAKPASRIQGKKGLHVQPSNSKGGGSAHTQISGWWQYTQIFLRKLPTESSEKNSAVLHLHRQHIPKNSLTAG